MTSRHARNGYSRHACGASKNVNGVVNLKIVQRDCNIDRLDIPLVASTNMTKTIVIIAPKDASELHLYFNLQERDGGQWDIPQAPK
jgi:hypothetical protein